MKNFLLTISFAVLNILCGQEKKDLYKIIKEVSSERIERDVRTLVSFGTRHTLSDTLSKTRGIGAARRWIKSEFEKISKECNNCLEVFYQKNYFTPKDGIVIDNFFFGVSTVGKNGFESPIVFPNSIFRD